MGGGPLTDGPEVTFAVSPGDFAGSPALWTFRAVSSVKTYVYVLQGALGDACRGSVGADRGACWNLEAMPPDPPPAYTSAHCAGSGAQLLLPLGPAGQVVVVIDTLRSEVNAQSQPSVQLYMGVHEAGCYDDPDLSTHRVTMCDDEEDNDGDSSPSAAGAGRDDADADCSVDAWPASAMFPPPQ
jgi:hypothetical protein